MRFPIFHGERDSAGEVIGMNPEENNVSKPNQLKVSKVMIYILRQMWVENQVGERGQTPEQSTFRAAINLHVSQSLNNIS